MNRSRSPKKVARTPQQSSSPAKLATKKSSSRALSSISASLAQTSSRVGSFQNGEFARSSGSAQAKQAMTPKLSPSYSPKSTLHSSTLASRFYSTTTNVKRNPSSFSSGFLAKSLSVAPASGVSQGVTRAHTIPQRTIVHDGKTDEELNKLVDSEKLVVIDWYADWCGPCRMFAPKFSQMSDKAEYNDVVFVRANIDDVQPPEGFPDVDSVPSFHIVKNKSVVHSFSGANEQRLTQAIEKYKS